jgi:hypothetical protein
LHRAALLEDGLQLDAQAHDRRDAEDALLQSIKHAHRLLLSDQPTFQILLSGGADSRGILATCCLLGVLPAKAISWGLLQDAPRSDAAIAKSLAERCGGAAGLHRYSRETFIENCEQWAYVLGAVE